MAPRGKRPLQKKIEFVNWLVLVSLLLLGSLFASVNFALGILAGGLISILNFYGLCRGLKTSFGEIAANKSPGKAALIIKYLLRLTVTGVVLYVILAKTNIDIFGLIIGLATVIVSIILTVMMTLIDKSYLEEV